MLPSIEMEALPAPAGRPTNSPASEAINLGQVRDDEIAGTAKSLATTLPLNPCESEPVKGTPVSAPLVPVVSVGVSGPMAQLKPSSLADAVRLALRLMFAVVKLLAKLTGPSSGALTVTSPAGSGTAPSPTRSGR